MHAMFRALHFLGMLFSLMFSLKFAYQGYFVRYSIFNWIDVLFFIACFFVIISIFFGLKFKAYSFLVFCIFLFCSIISAFFAEAEKVGGFSELNQSQTFWLVLFTALLSACGFVISVRVLLRIK